MLGTLGKLNLRPSRSRCTSRWRTLHRF